MRMTERPRHFAKHTRALAGRKWPAGLDTLGQRLAIHKRHREVHESVGLVYRVNGNDVRMRELGGQLRLAQEAVAQLRSGRELRGQELDGDEPVEVHFAREIHHAHAAATKLAVDGVAPGHRRLEREEHRIERGTRVRHFPSGGRRGTSLVQTPLSGSRHAEVLRGNRPRGNLFGAAR